MCRLQVALRGACRGLRTLSPSLDSTGATDHLGIQHCIVKGRGRGVSYMLLYTLGGQTEQERITVKVSIYKIRGTLSEPVALPYKGGSHPKAQLQTKHFFGIECIRARTSVGFHYNQGLH